MEKAIGNDKNSISKVSNRKFDRQRTVTRKSENFIVLRVLRVVETSHGPKECPVWQKTCSTCGKINHFQLMCKSKKRVNGKFTPEPKLAEDRRNHVKKVDESFRVTLIMST